MPGVERTRLIVQNESGGCKCGTNKSVCNSKHKWNHDECQCDYMWNPNACDCECNKIFRIDELFDIKNCSCEKHLIGNLVLESKDRIINTTEDSLNDKKVTW